MLLNKTLQNTRLNSWQNQIGSFFATSLQGTWRKRSFGLISLLFGFYLGSNITSYYIDRTGQRPLIAVVILLLYEVLVRLRSLGNRKGVPLYLLSIDNIRIGSIYAVVLEAFKLGS